jgi:hypothetical protein
LPLKGLKITSSLLTTNTEDEIYFADLNSAEFGLKKVNLAALGYKPVFVNSIINKNKLYILTEKEILVFSSAIKN